MAINIRQNKKSIFFKHHKKRLDINPSPPHAMFYGMLSTF